jgi:hypothetical protein
MASCLSRREFAGWISRACLAGSLFPLTSRAATSGELPQPPVPVLRYPGPWAFNLPKGSIILVSDQQLIDLGDPDREVDLSLSVTPWRTTLRQICQQQAAAGARTLILAFDHFWAQYRPGQGEKPRELMPDTDAYIRQLARLSEVVRAHGLGFELSLLSPLELGPGYVRKTGETGRWVQYREGLRDPQSGRYEVQLWEHRRWTNNKGSIDVRRVGVRVFAFRERRIGGTPFYVVKPAEIAEVNASPQLEEWEGARIASGSSFAARRLTVRGTGDTRMGPLDRVLVVLSYQTAEMDYFSPQALPFLKDLVNRYHAAGIPLNGLYADEMHIQQDWVYHGHHDEGQFTFRYLTPSLARAYADAFGAEFSDLEKYLVFFAYHQHGFLPGLDARLPAQHVLGDSPDDVQRTFLLRRRYYDLLGRTVVRLFAEAKRHAEAVYGHELEARAHATWAQSPTIDAWDTGSRPLAPRQYEYTPDFLWSNTVQQAAAACDDYFLWNDFLTGGGNDHTEGGWLDRNYYALALACSTGILNRIPYAYAAHWGMPAAVSERRQALVDAYGAAASPAFQAIEDSQHRDIEVLMLYPISLVACEERFGSWMVQYGYANYVTAARLLEQGRVGPGGTIELGGRRFSTLVALFEPLPPAGLLPFLEEFAGQGGRLIWSGPPPRFDLAGAAVLERWKVLFGIAELRGAHGGYSAPGEEVRFEGELRAVASQVILTAFLVDHVYPVLPGPTAEVVARSLAGILGVRRRLPNTGSTLYLGFRPRDDQAASLGYESRTWFEILKILGAYPPSRVPISANDNPSVVSRETPFLACRFPNGAITIAAHLCRYEESWPGGFHRNPNEDEAILARRPLPSDRLELEQYSVAGHRVSYRGRRIVAFRLSPDPDRRLLAFGGYDVGSLTVDGVSWDLARRPLPHLAWAPVAKDRRVAGGAWMEIWGRGAGEVHLPLPESPKSVRLFFPGTRPGSLGQPLLADVRDSTLVFTMGSDRPAWHLYAV